MRRPFFITLLCLLAACSPAPPRAPVAAPAEVRNAVVICLDTARFDTFDLAARLPGISDPFRPWSDRALRFSGAQAPAPWTLPSVASALTGLWPLQHGGGQLGGPVADLGTQVPSAVAPDAVGLPQRLADRGFRTAALAGHPWFEGGFGLERGFGEVTLFASGAEIAAAADTWLDGAAGRPERFLLYLHFMEAHDRHMVPDADLPARVAELPPALQAAGRAAAPAGICGLSRQEIYCQRFQLYLAALVDLQRAVAGLLAGLERRGLLDDTAVVLFSDHGEEFLEHWGVESKRAADPRGYFGFGHGHSLYQEVLHVPVLAWHPAAAGREVTERISLVDLAPTLAEWLGVEAPAGAFAGVSLADVASGGEPPAERPLFSSSIAYGPRQTAAVTGDWKRIVQRRPEARLLFELREDPRETAPIASIDQPQLEGVVRKARLDGAAEIARRLDFAIGRYRNLRRADQAAGRLDPEQLRRLQSLGYLTRR